MQCPGKAEPDGSHPLVAACSIFLTYAAMEQQGSMDRVIEGISCQCKGAPLALKLPYFSTFTPFQNAT